MSEMLKFSGLISSPLYNLYSALSKEHLTPMDSLQNNILC